MPMDFRRLNRGQKQWRTINMLSPVGPGTAPRDQLRHRYQHMMTSFDVFAERNADSEGVLMEYMVVKTALQRLIAALDEG